MIFRVNDERYTVSNREGGLDLMVSFQGCLHRCKDCLRPGCGMVLGGIKTDTAAVMKEMASIPHLQTVLLTGGEPFLQPGAALELARFAHGRGLKVRCHTGYRFEDLLEWNDTRRQLLKEIDILMDGPCGNPDRRTIDVKESLKKGEAVLHDRSQP